MTSRPQHRILRLKSNLVRGLVLALFGSMSLAHAGLAETRWIWKDGSDVANQAGVYTTPGLAHPSNTPGARQGAATWKDSSGNLWLYGGRGYDRNRILGYLSDLWKYELATSTWIWVKGPDVANIPGAYNWKNAPHPNARPGARYRAVSWTDAEGRFWLFGGQGYAGPNVVGGLNDLWMFDPNADSLATNNWTWFDLGGNLASASPNHAGNYGPIGVSSPTFLPPNREGAVGWADASGFLWLFGGQRTLSGGTTTAKLCDLWKFDIENRSWTYVKGTNETNSLCIYPSQGSSTTTSRPGSRSLAHAWTDSAGRFWLFGGHGYTTSDAAAGNLHDLWRYDPTANRWTWLHGSKLLNPPAHHGVLVDPNPSSIPGGMTEGLTWTDAQGDLWLYGGTGSAADPDIGELSALWRYRIATNDWTWMNGSSGVNEAPDFGSLGDHNPTNATSPGALHASAGWFVGNGLWLFGGENTTSAASYSAVWQLAELYDFAVTSGSATVPSGGTVAIGNSVVLAGVERTFTIQNTGLNGLSGLNVQISNAHFGSFVVTKPPASSLAPGASTSFAVTFTADSPTRPDLATALVTVDASSIAPYTFTATGTGIARTVNISAAPAWVWEDDGLGEEGGTALMEYTFTRDGGLGTPLTVYFSVSGTATFDVDYFASNADTFDTGAGSVTIPAGSATATVEIIPIADTEIESEETVHLNVLVGPQYLPGPENFAGGAIASEELLPGGRDRTFFPKFVGTGVLATAVQGDGRILVGGGFSEVNGVARNHLVRLLPDGTLDPSFDAALPSFGAVNAIIVQADGRIVISGGVSGLTRLLADGSPDPSFANPIIYALLNTLAQQPDGKLLVGGNFTAYDGQPRNRLARLDANGTLDPTFSTNIGADDHIHCIAVLPDGRILIGGSFTTIGGEPRSGLARLNADGTLDETFNPGAGAGGGWPVAVLALVVQPDGYIVIGGIFSTFNGEVRPHIARLESDGALDPTFSTAAAADQTIYTLALQTDGKILLGGYFDTANYQPSPDLARLNPDGTLDSTFQVVEGPSNGILGLTLLASGEVLASGNGSIVEESHSLLSRRANGPATQTLAPASGSVARWSRTGTGPELTRVTFDLSTDGGASWTPLGPGSRVEGGWELGGQALPITGQLRARGHTAGGYLSASSSLIEQVQPFTRAPEIVVESPTGEVLVDGVSTYDFGVKTYPVPPPTIAQPLQYFIIRNVGNADLTYPTFAIDGAPPSDFSFNGPFSFPEPTFIPPGGIRAFAYTFTPRARGERTTILRIGSNDADENTFDIHFKGTGATTPEVWRHTHFGTLANTGPAADDADPDGDGTRNLLERYAGLNPNDPTARFQVRIEPVEGQPHQRKILFNGLPFTWNGSTMIAPTVVIQYRTSLTEGDWQPLDNGEFINWGYPEWWKLDTDAGPTKFYRVEITGQ